MQKWIGHAFLCLGWIFVCSSNQADGAFVTIDLGEADVSAAVATFDISITFTGEPGDRLDHIVLSVLGSDPQLTMDGADFRRFAFSLNPTTLPGWIEESSLNPFGIGVYAPADPTSGPFLEPTDGAVTIGTLTVDLTGIAPGTESFVTLASAGGGLATDVGGTADGVDISSFATDTTGAAGLAFADPNGVSFQVVPEPASLVSAAIGTLLLAGYAGIRRIRGS